MARPLLRALKIRIGELGGYKAILDRVAEGETLQTICKDYGVSRGMLSMALNRNKDIRPLLDEARRVAAHAMAEQALQIVDDAPVSRDHISKAKEQAAYRKWLAGVYDRATFGEPTANITQTITVQSLHLAALKAQPRQAIPQQSVPVLEASHG